MRRLRAAVRKEFLQFSRDWLLLGLILFIYTGDVMLCTYALSFDVRNLSLAVYDQDRSQLSRKLVERFTATDYFGRLLPVESLGEVDRLIDGGKADLALIVPPRFAELAAEGRPATVQVLLSGVNSNTANAARGYANSIVEGFSHDLLREAVATHGVLPRLPNVASSMRIWYNPQLQFRFFMVIGMIVSAGLMVGIITTAASMVREKETGTIEQLMVTPLRRHEIVLAKMAPPFAVGMLSLVPSLGIVLWFGVPVEGSVSVFLLASAVALLASMAIGIFVSTFAHNLQQGLLISFFVLFPLMFLSGTIVLLESMPLLMRWLSFVSPLRYHMEIALGIFLKGVGWSVLWPQFVGLIAIGTLLLGWSLLRLRRHLYA
jgi:ABC-2 type transport system permease protein